MTESHDLSKVAEQLRLCGNAFISIADVLTAEPAKDSKEEPAQKPVTFEDVRKVLSDKSGKGFTDQVKALLLKHGAGKFSEIDPAEYPALLAEAEALGDG